MVGLFGFGLGNGNRTRNPRNRAAQAFDFASTTSKPGARPSRFLRRGGFRERKERDRKAGSPA
jgi:hypothetical protein